MKKEIMIRNIVEKRLQYGNDNRLNGNELAFKNAGELHEFGLFVKINGIRIEDNEGYYAQFKLSLYRGLLNEVNQELGAVC